MDYEALAKQFCELEFLQARKRSGLEQVLSLAGENGVLMCLFRSPRRLLAGEVARELGLSPARTTNILNALERRGYVVKECDRQDRRKIYVQLTQEGRRHVGQMYDCAVARYRALLERLGEHDAKEYFRIMKRIHEMPGGGPPHPPP